MIITDTHTHLYSDAFDEDRKAAIQEAIDNNVKRFFIPAIDSETTQAMYQLEKDFPENIFLMMGLHPTHVKENYKEELKHIEELLTRRSFYAIGEIGIDLYWDKTFLKQQQEAFKYQIQLARRSNHRVDGPKRDRKNCQGNAGGCGRLHPETNQSGAVASLYGKCTNDE